MESNRPENNIWAFYPLMLVPGIVLLLAPSTVETIMKFYHFHESLGGLLQVAYFTGGLVGILSITLLMQKFDPRRLLLSQVALLIGSLLAASFAPSYPFLLFFYVISGLANGILITFPGVYVTQVSGESSHHAQTILYSFFSLGVVIGPLLTALVIHDHTSAWRWAFRAPALLIIPLSLPVAFVSLKELDGVKAISRRTIRAIVDFNSSLFFGLLAALLFYIAAETAVSMWLITYLKDQHHMGLGAAHWVLTGLWLGLTIGRWVFGPLLKRTNPFNVLVPLSIAAGVTLLVAPLTNSKEAAILMYPLVGLFYSCIYPILVGYASWFPEDLSSLVFTLFLSVGAFGGAVLPYLIGLINQYVGLVVGMCSISVLLAGVAACLFRLHSTVMGRTTKPPGIESTPDTST